MEVISIGTDLVSISRMEGVLARRGERLTKRVLSNREQREFNNLRSAHAAYMAGRFAAREAAAKALGTGIAQGVSWRDFEVSHEPSGAPCLSLSAGALNKAEGMGAKKALLSLSDEGDYALAFVVLVG